MMRHTTYVNRISTRPDVARRYDPAHRAAQSRLQMCSHYFSVYFDPNGKYFYQMTVDLARNIETKDIKGHEMTLHSRRSPAFAALMYVVVLICNKLVRSDTQGHFKLQNEK